MTDLFATRSTYCRLCGHTIDTGHCPDHDPQPETKDKPE